MDMLVHRFYTFLEMGALQHNAAETECIAYIRYNLGNMCT